MATGTSVSLVIPVRNEAASIETLVRSIGQQVRQPDEVLLIDGGSTDGTADTIRCLVGDDDRYRLIEAGPATPGRGRNVGIEATTHPWVALTDAGITLDPFWLERLVRVSITTQQSRSCTGPTVLVASFFERCADLAYVSPLATCPVGPVRSRSVASCLVRKEVWQRAGGFPDLRASEDRIFMRELDALGCKILVAPEARVIWQLQPTLGRTFQRFRRYSTHNALTGEQWNWHHGVARMYLVGFGLIVAARKARRSPVPVVAAIGMLRVARTLWRRREGRGLAWLLRPHQFATVAAILAVIDAATFLGWIEAYLPPHRRNRRA